MPASIPEIRKKYPRTYEPWTAEEEQLLLESLQKSRKIPDIAKQFQRNPSALRTRMKRLLSSSPRDQSLLAQPKPQPSANNVFYSTNTPNQQLQIILEGSWQAVETSPDLAYQYPNQVSYHMLETYKYGCIYRWAIYQQGSETPYALYVGSTKQLCPDRLENYREPKNSATNLRICQQLMDFLAQGYTVRLEVFHDGRIRLSNLVLNILDFETQRDRLFIEHLIIAYFRLMGERLLNL